MPKISSSANSSAKMSDSPAKMTDIALRKKKNADAQAAFRARRTNYIQTLEETVTNLESVVLQLQDSCRDARNEAQELRQENGRLRLQLKEREHFWRTVWSRKNQSDGDDFPALPPGSFNGSLTVGSQVHQYGDVRAYREDSAIPCTQTQSPIGAYSTVDTDVPGQRTSKYSSDAYFSAVSHPSWPAQSVTQSSSSGGELGIHPSTTHAPNSPNYTNSPPLASPEVTFPRFPSQIEDQKVSVTSTLESTPFVFSSSSRSLTPTVSTPPTSSTTPLAPFQFRVSDAVHERPHPPGTGSLSGAPPNGSLGTVGNDGRYRPGSNRRDGPLLPTVLPPLSGGSDNGSQHGSDGDSGVAPQISGTLAVLKAQSFGALRRTRTRTKRPVESAAKVAMDVLESRGLGMSVQTGVKRQRRCEDEGDGGS
ncbi:hypothetical protein E1B28_001100 [Marasmius oreades]|uniref:BZIP domain-containing protein n=1 Tax=Marasmius oreades TaxID=181124 RepID=A0A9P7V2Q6_9AGAR|nr:uncharacterized protein E1B28_001100 [Marasmius oreades]KAG7099235.1 hypothetical protein E1B28_001100 [Marasmius oreades]